MLIPDFQYLHEYLDSNIVRITYQLFNDSFKDWDNYKKYEIWYDSLKHITKKVEYIWNFDSLAWLPNDRYDMVYNKNNKIIFESIQVFNNNDQKWENGYEKITSYDASGNLVSIEELYNWNSYSEIYEFQEKKVHSCVQNK